MSQQVPNLAALIGGADQGDSGRDVPIPQAKELNDSVAKVGIARIVFGISLFGLLLINIVNTGMLGRILAELQVIPPGLRFGIFALSQVFAFVVTLAETSFGFTFHWALSKSAEADAPNGSFLSVLGWRSLAAAALGGGIVASIVEGNWWAQIAPPGVATIPVLNVQLPQSQFYFLFGVIIVAALFSLGFMLHSSIETWWEGNAVSALRRQCRKLIRLNELRRDSVLRAKQALQEVKKHADTAEGTVRSDLVRRLDELAQRVDSAASSLGATQDSESGGARSRPLKSVELYRIGLHLALWLLLGAASLYLGTILGGRVLTEFYPQLDAFVSAAIAVGILLTFLGLGFVSHTSEHVIDANGVLMTVSRGWSRILAWGLASALVGFYLIVLITKAWPLDDVGSWLGHLLLGLLILTSGFQIAPRIGTVGVLGKWIRNLTYALAELLTRLSLHIVHVAVIVVEVLLRVLVAPIALFRRPDSSRVAALPKPRARAASAPGEMHDEDV